VTAGGPGSTNEIVSALERDWPHWQVWVVHRTVGGPVWCARRRDDADAVPARVLNAGSAGELTEQLEEATAAGET
jgi:hypothetical protein